MSLAIATSKGDFIYFDAVINYTEAYANSVTKHPVDGGGVISDHVSMENPCFTISGVISAVDFNITRPAVSDPSTGKAINFFNTNPVEFYLEVRDNDVTKSTSFLSGLSKTPPAPTISMADEVKYNYDAIKNLLIDLRDNSKNADSNYGLFSIYEFRDGLISSSPKINCVLSGLDFNETPDTGDCIDVSLKIEQVVFVILSKTGLPKDVLAKLNDKASDESSKGKQGETPTTTPPKPEIRKSQLLQGAQGFGLFQ